MDAASFQALALGFIAALIVVIPAAGGAVIVGLQTWHRIVTVAETTGKVQSAVAAHEQRLNGELDMRIDSRAKSLIAQHVDPKSIVISPPTIAPVVPNVPGEVDWAALFAQMLETFYARGNAPGAHGGAGAGRGSGVSGNAPPGSGSTGG